MAVNYRSLAAALIVVCTTLAAPSAQALVIKASNYPVGTNLSHAFAGVTLGYVSYNGYGPGYTVSPLVISTDADFSSGGPTQFNTFGGSTDDAGYPPFQIPSNDGQWDAIYIAFTVPVYSVSAVGYNEDDDPTFMVAYGQQTIVAQDNGGPLPRPCIPSPYPGIACLESHEETVTSPTPISYILLGGESETTYYTQLYIPGITAVPEPSSVALLGGGLFAVGIALLRRRRQLGAPNLLAPCGD